MSDTFQPEIPEEAENAVAAIPAITTPDRVPPVAANVLRVGPPIRYSVTTVVRAQISTAVQKGENPR